jgi:hypothetical protein
MRLSGHDRQSLYMPPERFVRSVSATAFCSLRPSGRGLHKGDGAHKCLIAGAMGVIANDR